jgi:hypothetical protein
LGIREKSRYGLKDLISRRQWSEHGTDSWKGRDLLDFSLTPRPFVPYFFEISSREPEESGCG